VLSWASWPHAPGVYRLEQLKDAVACTVAGRTTRTNVIRYIHERRGWAAQDHQTV
jgi:hypothetical protein